MVAACISHVAFDQVEVALFGLPVVDEVRAHDGLLLVGETETVADLVVELSHLRIAVLDLDHEDLQGAGWLDAECRPTQRPQDA